jgi:hypothetical protein
LGAGASALAHGLFLVMATVTILAPWRTSRDHPRVARHRLFGLLAKLRLWEEGPRARCFKQEVAPSDSSSGPADVACLNALGRGVTLQRRRRYSQEFKWKFGTTTSFVDADKCVASSQGLRGPHFLFDPLNRSGP